MIYLEKLEEARKKKGRCWTGYKPKPGSVPYSKGSCVKEAYKLIGLALIDEEETKPPRQTSYGAMADQVRKRIEARKKSRRELHNQAVASEKPEPEPKP